MKLKTLHFKQFKQVNLKINLWIELMYVLDCWLIDDRQAFGYQPIWTFLVYAAKVLAIIVNDLSVSY